MMSPGPGVTLQISLAPVDLPHAGHILPHQLRQWAGQVDDVLFTLDLHQSRGGRHAGDHRDKLPGLRRLIERCRARYSKIRLREVDYGGGVAADLSSTFLDGHPVPPKAWDGSPFYAYLFGLYAARNDFIFHLDSDMLFGGGSPVWITEAVQLLASRPDVLACSPLPGPPTADGFLRSQVAEPEPHSSLAFRFPHLSTRLFLLDRKRLRSRLGQLPLIRLGGFRLRQAERLGNPPYDRPEDVFTLAMREGGLVRVDFLGSDPGMWSIHPLYRSKDFYARLPALIEQIETGDVPEAQRGHHDMNHSMVELSP